MAPGNIPTKRILFRSSDRQLFEVPEKVARQSRMVNKHMNDSEDERIAVKQMVIPVDFTAEVLANVLTCCEKLAAGEDSSTMSASNSELNYWEVGFFVGVDEDMLWSLHAAGKYLRIDGLVGLTSWKFHEMKMQKNAAEARRPKSFIDGLFKR